MSRAYIYIYNRQTLILLLVKNTLKITSLPLNTFRVKWLRNSALYGLTTFSLFGKNQPPKPCLKQYIQLRIFEYFGYCVVNFCCLLVL